MSPLWAPRRGGRRGWRAAVVPAAGVLVHRRGGDRQEPGDLRCRAQRAVEHDHGLGGNGPLLVLHHSSKARLPISSGTRSELGPAPPDLDRDSAEWSVRVKASRERSRTAARVPAGLDSGAQRSYPARGGATATDRQIARRPEPSSDRPLPRLHARHVAISLARPADQQRVPGAHHCRPHDRRHASRILARLA